MERPAGIPITRGGCVSSSHHLRIPAAEHHVRINSKVARNINRSLVLNAVRERQPISRTEIAALTRLNKSTVSSITSGLIDEELVVEESGSLNGRVGRPSVGLRLRKGRYLVGAAAIDAGATTIAIVDIDGTIAHSVEIPTAAATPRAFVQLCVTRLADLRALHSLPELQGMGVAIAGIVDPVRSLVTFAPNLGWEDVDLGNLFAEYGADLSAVHIENDAKASALAELWYGRHDVELSDFVFLAIGRGIGTGVVINRQIVTGESYAAGEFGHLTLIEDGDPCACGNRGCWETYASDRATGNRYRSATGLPPSETAGDLIDTIVAAARAGDPVARETLRQTGMYIGMGVANIVKAIDPSAVIIGGRVTNAWDLIFPEIMKAASQRVIFGKQAKTRILPTSLPASSSVLGAAMLCIRTLFKEY
jgi:predicted NBD/HSP70 family sugar kinase